MSLISDTILSYLPAKRKHTPSGWISFNAPCCNDKRQRGGIIFNAGDAVSYHCFNCQFKASWQPGRQLSTKIKKLLRLLNVSDDTIDKLSLEALRLTSESSIKIKSVIPQFDERALPMDALPITDYLDDPPEKLIPVIEYMVSRNLYLEDYTFYWSSRPGFSNRLIIPFYYQGKIVGYTARIVNSNANPRYLSEQQPGYVFNMDHQTSDREFVIVCEGPIDAISIDGCAVMGAEIKSSQNLLLKQLNKEIIFVPDRDHEGPKTIDQAISYEWSVSMPDWPDGIKDINDAIIKIGKTATLWLIVKSKLTNELKIRLHAKKWFKEISNEKNT